MHRFHILFLLGGLILPFPVSARAEQAQPAAYAYQGNLKINPETGHIQADWEIRVHDPTETSVTFLLRDTLTAVEAGGPALAGWSSAPQSGLEEFTAVNVALKPGIEDRVVRLSYSGVLIPEPMENRINAIEPGRVELNVDSFWFPIDARFNKLLTANVTVQIPGEWEGVTTGEAEAIEGGIRIRNTDPRIDISFTLSRSFRITRAKGFTIYDQRESADGTDRLLETAGRCRDFLNARFGTPTPLPPGRLLITDRPSSGYARENYIVFTDISATELPALTRFVCHEFGHFWARGGKFDTVENWINESFAEYLGMIAVREFLGQDAYDVMVAAFEAQIADESLPPIWRPGDTARSLPRELPQGTAGPGAPRATDRQKEVPRVHAGAVPVPGEDHTPAARHPGANGRI